MKENNNPSRREFLEKMAAGTLGLAVSAGLGERLLASPVHHHKADLPAPAKSGKRLIPVMITPYKSDSSIDYDGVSRLTDFYLAAGAKGFFANCLSSEMYYMDDAERIALTKHVVKYVDGKVSVVSTGSFGKTMKKKAAFTRKIHDTGADAVILISSHFAEKAESDDILIENFGKFFDRTGNIPLGTYECPAPYKRILSPKVFKFLVANDRLIYHKDTCEDINKIKAKLELIGSSKMEFYDAHTASALPALQMGASGMSPISANFYPEILAWMCENATNPSKSEDAKWIQSEITRTEPLISKVYPVSAKYFLKKRGLPIEMICRSNSGKLSAEQMKVLDDTYKVFLGWCDRLGIKPVRV